MTAAPTSGYVFTSVPLLLILSPAWVDVVTTDGVPPIDELAIKQHVVDHRGDFPQFRELGRHGFGPRAFAGKQGGRELRYPCGSSFRIFILLTTIVVLFVVCHRETVRWGIFVIEVVIELLVLFLLVQAAQIHIGTFGRLDDL
jgi:hypothetical protein